MAKAIRTDVIISSIRTRKDGSLGFSGETPELTTEEKVAFMELQNTRLSTLFHPADDMVAEEVAVSGDLQPKSHSTRMRNVLYVLWRSEYEGADTAPPFHEFYAEWMEDMINQVKDRLPDMNTGFGRH